MKRSSGFDSLKLNIDRMASVSLYRQVYRQLRNSIMRGDLCAGFILPATRDLATKLGVSRNTVLNAYEALCFEGLAIGTTGCCTRVRGPASTPRKPSIAKPLDGWAILRAAHFPERAIGLGDPDGNVLYVYR